MPSIVGEVLASPGEGLDHATRTNMEERFGHRFGHVRVHDDERAARSARAVKAVAYTVGSDIVLGSPFASHSEEGRRVLAHELVHVVQQGGSGASGVIPSSIEEADAPAEREAQRLAEAVTVGGPVPVVGEAARKVQRLDVEDCSEEHGKEVRAAYSEALTDLVAVANVLGESTPATDAAIRKYFGSYGLDHRSGLALRLLKIRAALPGATIECENPDSWFYDQFCGGALAYVRPAPAFFGVGNIHVCQPGFHNLTETQRMATVVHEAAHRYIDADDEGYYTLACDETAETKGLDDYERYENADSFACLVQTLK